MLRWRLGGAGGRVCVRDWAPGALNGIPVPAGGRVAAARVMPAPSGFAMDLLCLALCRHHPSSFLSSNVLSAPPPDAPRGRHRHHAGHARPQAYPPPTHAAVGRWRRRIGGCAHGSARGDRPGTDAACRVRPSRLGLRLGAWEAYLLLRAVVCSIFNCACRVRALCFFWGGGQGGDGDGIARRRRRGWWASFFLLIDSADCVTLSCWPPQ